MQYIDNAKSWTGKSASKIIKSYSKPPLTEMAGGRPSARQCGQPTLNRGTLDSK